MKYATEIEACFESVFRDIGTSDADWDNKYATFLELIDIRLIEKWAIQLIEEGKSKEEAFHHIEKHINNKNEQSNKILY